MIGVHVHRFDGYSSYLSEYAPSTSLKRLYRACSCPCCCCMAVDCDGEEAAMLGEEASVHAEWQGGCYPPRICLAKVAILQPSSLALSAGQLS